jgi:hypothetical protein
MSIRTGSRPKWLYWTENGWHYIARLRLHIALRAGKSNRRSDDYAGYTSRQRSAADDHTLAGFAGFAVFALGSTTLGGGLVLGPSSVTSGQFPLCIGIGGESLPPPAFLSS